MSLSRRVLEALHRKESDASLKERLLLILKVEGDGMIPLVLQRSCTEAAFDWLGLSNKPKSGRPSKLPEEVAVKIS